LDERLRHMPSLPYLMPGAPGSWPFFDAVLTEHGLPGSGVEFPTVQPGGAVIDGIEDHCFAYVEHLGSVADGHLVFGHRVTSQSLVFLYVVDVEHSVVRRDPARVLGKDAVDGSEFLGFPQSVPLHGTDDGLCGCKGDGTFWRRRGIREIVV